jgi:hypothetical protein
MTLVAQALDLISDFRPFHSLFQIDNVIIGQNGFGDDSDESVFGTFLQIQREIQSRLGALSAQRTELYRLQVQHLKVLKESRRWWCYTAMQKLEKAIAVSEVSRLEFEIQQLHQTTADVARELTVFVERGERLKNRVRSWTVEQKEEIELCWWLRRFERRLTAGALYGSPCGETIEVLADMPADFRTRLRALVDKGTIKLPHVGSVLNALQDAYGRNDRRLNSSPSTARQHPSANENSRVHGSLPSSALAY